MQKQPKDARHTADTLAFFKWAFENGQAQAKALDYVPLPPELVAQVETYWTATFLEQMRWVRAQQAAARAARP